MYGHPNAPSNRRLFGRRRRSLASVFWLAYLFFVSLACVLLAGVYLWR